MARKLIVEIVGDASSLERSFNRAQRSTRGFGKDMERAGRGAVVASVGFRGLGRSVAFASAAFIGGAGITAAIRSTIAAAADSERVGAQLTNVLDKQGLATKRNKAAIEARTQALSQMSGFDDELATQTFANLLRVTNDVDKALRDNALAADIARARNIDLQSAAQLVTKAELGQAGALRRVGIAARTGASSVELLDLLQRKFAGSAEAYGNTAAGAQDRFRVALENTQEAIGQALLPSLTRLLNRATAWLNNQENQKRIQDLVNSAVDKGEKVAGALADGYDKMRRATNWMRWHDPFGVIGLEELAAFGKSHALDALIQQFDDLRRAQKRVKDGYNEIEKARRGAITGREPRSVIGLLPGKVAGATFVGRPLTREEQLNIALAANPDDVNALKAQRALRQRALDFAQKQLHLERGNTAKFAQAAERLTGDIAAINQRLAAIAEENAAKARQAADRAKDAAEKRRQAVLDAISAWHGGTAVISGAIERARRGLMPARIRGIGFAAPGVLQAAQFQALGLTATGDELAPTRKALQAGLSKIEAGLGGTLLDTDKNRNLISRIRKVLSGQLGALSRDVRLKIQDLEDALTGDGKLGGPLTDIQAVTGRKLAQTLGNRLGLTPEQIRQMRLNITGAHFTSGSLAGAAGFSPTIHTRVDIDGRQVALATHQHSERSRRRTAPQTRGRVLP